MPEGVEVGDMAVVNRKLIMRCKYEGAGSVGFQETHMMYSLLGA